MGRSYDKDMADNANDSGRRNLTLGLLGMLTGGALLSACGPEDEGAQAQDGFALDHVDSALGTGLLSFATVTELTSFNASTLANQSVALLLGYAAAGDGGGGALWWDAGSTATGDNGTVFAVTGGVWRRIYSGSSVNVRWFGARAVDDPTASGAWNSGPAFRSAVATSSRVSVPTGNYRVEGSLNVTTSSLVGENASLRSRLTFISSGSAAILIDSGPTRVLLENLEIVASSRASCPGYGIDHDSPVTFRNVLVSNFARSNIWSHWNASGTMGPFGSYAENVSSYYAGEHGWLVGYGGSTMNIINYEGKWCGGPTDFSVPATAGTGCGFKVTGTSDGASLVALNPESLYVVGGDCSYNAGYGWNIDNVAESDLQLGYAEGNQTKEVRVGNLRNVVVRIAEMYQGRLGFQDDLNYQASVFRTRVYYGGKQIAPVEDFDLVCNPSANDFNSSDNLVNAPQRHKHLSRTHDGQNLTWFACNYTPDGTSTDLSTQAVLSLTGYGNAAIGLGIGPHHIKLSWNTVRLPQTLALANGPGWNASSSLSIRLPAAPTTGTWSTGDTCWNTAPVSGGYVGWVCTAGGSPGTWNGFGQIA